MVTRAFGSVRQSYTLAIGAAQDSSLPRVFGRVDRQVQATRDRVDELRASQRRLQSELRGVRKGTEAYERLQTEIRQTRDEADRLTDELGRQESAWRDLGRSTNRWRNLTLGAFGAVTGVFAGGAVAIQRMGDEFARVNFVAQRTRLPVEEIQRFQIAARGLGGDLDAIDLLEFDVRLGEIRDGLLRGEPALQGTKNAFEALGLDVRTVSARDIPLLIERLRALPPALAQFYSDEIFSGTAAEQFIAPLLTASDEYIERVRQTSVLSQEQGDRILEARGAMAQMRQETAVLTASLATGLTPAITGIVDAIGPAVQGFGQFASQNPEVVQAGLALVGILGSVTAALWALNAARAAALALSGPVGWGILGAAAGLLVAGGITAAVLTSRSGRQQRLEESRRAGLAREEAERQADQVSQATRLGAFEGVFEASDIAASRNADALRNIIPSCPDAAIQRDIAETAAMAAGRTVTSIPGLIDDESALSPATIERLNRYGPGIADDYGRPTGQLAGELTARARAELEAETRNIGREQSRLQGVADRSVDKIAEVQRQIDHNLRALANLQDRSEQTIGHAARPVTPNNDRAILSRRINDLRAELSALRATQRDALSSIADLEPERQAGLERLGVDEVPRSQGGDIRDRARGQQMPAGAVAPELERPPGLERLSGDAGPAARGGDRQPDRGEIPAITIGPAAPAQTTTNVAGDDNRRSDQTTTNVAGDDNRRSDQTTTNVAGDDNRRSTVINIEQTNNINTTEAASEVEAGVQQAVSDYAVGR